MGVVDEESKTGKPGKRKAPDDERGKEEHKPKIPRRTSKASDEDLVPQSALKTQKDARRSDHGEIGANKSVPTDPNKIMSLIQIQLDKIQEDQSVTEPQYLGACLRTAATKNYREVIERLLTRAGLDANARDGKGRTAFMKASACGHDDIVRLCLKNPRFDISLVSNSKDTVLHYASKNGQASTARLLLEDKEGAKLLNLANAQGTTALMRACEAGSIETVKVLLQEKGIAVNLQDVNGDSALMHSTNQGREDLVRELINGGASVNQQNNNGDTCLMMSANEGFANIVHRLLSVPSIDVNIKNVDGYNSLMCAADKGHKEIVKDLLAMPKLHINAKDQSGDNALVWAVDKNNHDVVGLLCARDDLELSEQNVEVVVHSVVGTRSKITEEIRQDAVVKAVLDKRPAEGLFLLKSCQGPLKLDVASLFLSCVQEGFSSIVDYMLTNKMLLSIVLKDTKLPPLISAASSSNKSGSLETVKVLLKHKVDVNARNVEKNTALMVACDKKRADLVALLCDQPGIDVNCMNDKDKFTPLLISTGHSDLESIRALTKVKSLEVNKQGFEGKSALIWAAENGHTEAIRLLMEAGSNINLQDTNGYTSLMWAADMCHVEATKELLSYPGVNLNARDVDGHTALTWASDKGDEDIVKALLEQEDIEVNVKDEQGLSPFILAAAANSPVVVEILANDSRTDVNIKNNEGDTALHVAVEHGFDECVKVLLDCRRVGRGLTNSAGQTAEKIAKVKGGKKNSSSKAKDILALFS